MVLSESVRHKDDVVSGVNRLRQQLHDAVSSPNPVPSLSVMERCWTRKMGEKCIQLLPFLPPIPQGRGENHPKWKGNEYWRYTHFPLNHDYGRKGSWLDFSINKIQICRCRQARLQPLKIVFFYDLKLGKQHFVSTHSYDKVLRRAVNSAVLQPLKWIQVFSVRFSLTFRYIPSREVQENHRLKSADWYGDMLYSSLEGRVMKGISFLLYWLTKPQLHPPQNTENHGTFLRIAANPEVTNSRAPAIETQLRQQLGEFSQARTGRTLWSLKTNEFPPENPGVEVGSLSHYLRQVYTCKRWLALGFLNHHSRIP